MKDIINGLIERFRRQHVQARRYVALMLVLALLMVFFSLLEGMAFRETGLREGHGNFTWAANSSSFVLWVVMAGIFLREFVSGLKAKTLSSGRKVAYAVGFALMGWHAASGVYYLYFLLSTGNAF